MSEAMKRAALVTGASRGIGREIALQLAARGVRVGVHFRSNRAAAESVLAELPGGGHAAFGGHGRRRRGGPAWERGLRGARSDRHRGQQRRGARGAPSPCDRLRGVAPGLGADHRRQPPRARQPLASRGAGHGALRRRTDRQHLLAGGVPRGARGPGLRRQQGGSQFAQPVAREGPGAGRRAGLLHRTGMGRDRDGCRPSSPGRGAPRSGASIRSAGWRGPTRSPASRSSARWTRPRP
jgi:hypothetical protein